jgi:flagellin-specific chaperone FliS
MGDGWLAHLDSAVTELEKARTVLAHATLDAWPAALDDAFAAVGALYADLDDADSREVTSHLSAVYEWCLKSIGDARLGRADGLQCAIELLLQLRLAEERAPSEPRLRHG